jgi:hypothetical protein
MAGKFTVGNFNKAKGVPGKTALGETKDGAPQLTVVFEGVGGKTGGDEIERRFMLNDERLAYTMDTLTLMGWGGDWEDFSGIGKNTVSLKISQSDQYGLQVDFVNEDKPFILAPEKKTAILSTLKGKSGSPEVKAALKKIADDRAEREAKRAAEGSAPAAAPAPAAEDKGTDKF